MNKDALMMELEAGMWPIGEARKDMDIRPFPVLTQQQIDESVRRAEEDILKYLKESLQRLLNGERSGAVPEEMIPLCINRLKQAIQEKEDKLNNAK